MNPFNRFSAYLSLRQFIYPYSGNIFTNDLIYRRRRFILTTLPSSVLQSTHSLMNQIISSPSIHPCNSPSILAKSLHQSIDPCSDPFILEVVHWSLQQFIHLCSSPFILAEVHSCLKQSIRYLQQYIHLCSSPFILWTVHSSTQQSINPCSSPIILATVIHPCSNHFILAAVQ